jgi:hypothetical protein
VFMCYLRYCVICVELMCDFAYAHIVIISVPILAQAVESQNSKCFGNEPTK